MDKMGETGIRTLAKLLEDSSLGLWEDSNEINYMKLIAQYSQFPYGQVSHDLSGL